MSLNGKSLLQPNWINGKPYCQFCDNFHDGVRKPLTILVEKTEYILYGCLRCHRLFRGKVKTLRALEEILKIKDLLIEKKHKERCLKTWQLCRAIQNELNDLEAKIKESK